MEFTGYDQRVIYHLQWSIHMYRKNILMIWMNLISPKYLYMIIWKQKDICHAILDRSWSYVRQMNGSQSCLQVERGTAIYKIDYRGADADYNIVEFTMSYLNPAYTKFRFDVEVP